jgi:hypothetical protein
MPEEIDLDDDEDAALERAWDRLEREGSLDDGKWEPFHGPQGGHWERHTDGRVRPIRGGKKTPFERTGPPERYAFNEAEHPRGQPENAGEFGPGGVGEGKPSGGMGPRGLIPVVLPGGGKPAPAVITPSVPTPAAPAADSKPEGETPQDDDDDWGGDDDDAWTQTPYLTDIAREVRDTVEAGVNPLSPDDYAKLPPIVVEETPSGKLLIVDGFHRTAGLVTWAQQNGVDLEDIEPEVVVCKNSKLIEHAAEPGGRQNEALAEIYRRAGVET